MDINLKMINENGTILEFKGCISNSSDQILQISFIPNPDLSNIQINSRFIIGTIFPRAYKVVGINEYDGITHDRVSMILRLDQINPLNDNLELKIADYNKKGEKINE